ncbi:NAD(P)-dependent oxidoreductase [Rhodovibrio salinarum]|uniref:Dihydropyrimidine dehydrogenase n=1 Tax=Rhodovibrio salinarum TaxID=1087 RepID=A0A934QIL9_9PROT|nr:NAD(P)-dependent oxidoreductase [Rhodovibrio salinarum]MBK1697397.1 dihydropyrimidine dehydrogenase [Rhodovibrio salinarum]
MAESTHPRDVSTGRLAPDQLASNFADAYPPLSDHAAVVEASRCYFCYDAPCLNACPTQIDIPLFIRQIAAGNNLGAAETILQQNVMGGMCARVCPTETLCEEACVRVASEGKPVKIGLLQRHATDALFEDGRQVFARAAPTGKTVAVVGAGPAGLACAHRLAVLGHDVTMFDARPKGGGLNEYGIAAYKAVDDFAQRELAYILEIGGIQLETGKALGRDMQLADLRRDYDAVFLGMGLAGVNALGVEGEDLDGALDAVDYIADLRQARDLSSLPVGRRVVVVGGGMTAVDIAVQSKLLGAEDVTIVYRRGPDRMNASVVEQEHAQTAGVQIKHWLAPKRVLGGPEGVTGIELEYTRTGSNGQLEGTGETRTLAADVVFKAIGQTLGANGALTADETAIALEGGRIRVDAARATSLPGVWAGGDCIAGGEDLTVAAVEDGKQAALSIHTHLLSA